MGDFTLGCLLGQYDGAQSFDISSQTLGVYVNSWWKNLDQTVDYRDYRIGF